MTDLLTVSVAFSAICGAGFLLAVALLPRPMQSWWLAGGLAPLLACGVFFGVGGIFGVVGVDVMSPLVPVSVIALVVGVAVARRRHVAWAGLTPTRADVLDLVILAAVCGIAVYAWVRARGGDLLLPNYDAMNHSLFVRRIVEEGTLDPSRIVVQDPTTETTVANYYPLSLHFLSAHVVEWGTLSIPTTLFLITAFTAGVMWPIGMYALTRALLPWRWAPVVSAAFASTAIQFPYKPISWGGLTTIVGISLMPAVIALCLLCLRMGQFSVPALGLSVGSLFVVHNTQLVAAAIFTVTLGCAFVLTRETWRGLTIRDGLLFVATALGPTITILPDLASGAEERATIPSYFGDVASVIGQTMTVSMNSERSTVIPLVLVLAGCAVAFAARVGRSVFVAYAVVVALVLVASLDEWWTSPFHPLVIPWYAQYERVAYNLVIPVSLFGAIAVVGGGQMLATRVTGLSNRHRHLLVNGTYAALLIAVTGVTIGNARNLTAAVERDIAYFQILDLELVEQAGALADEQGGRINVLATPESGGMWLYVLDPRIETAGAFFGTEASGQEFAELIGRLPDATKDPWVDATLDKYGIDFVYTNGFGMNGAPSAPAEDALAANACFALVAEAGDDRLWRVC
jgi:hypothetical protein